MKIERLIINVDGSYLNDEVTEKFINKNGLSYNVDRKIKASGFNFSNIYIGKDNIELVEIKNKVNDWIEQYSNSYLIGRRGLVGLVIGSNDLKKDHDRIAQSGIGVSDFYQITYHKFKQLIKVKRPYQNIFIDFFDNIPLQLVLQELNDASYKETYYSKMKPNSKAQGINRISIVEIYGPFTDGDFKKIEVVFNIEKRCGSSISINLHSSQVILFIKDPVYRINVITDCDNSTYANKTVSIENLKIINRYTG